MKNDTTTKEYTFMQDAYNYYNSKLFDSQLPGSLMTLVNKANSKGYYSPEKFYNRKENSSTDEISLNHSVMDRPDIEILSTLVHEMVHQWQFHFGQFPRKAYHDKQWARKMEEVGLIPSSTGEPGGDKTGQRVSHYIEPGGKFEVVSKYFLSSGTGFSWKSIDIPGEKKERESKVKYTCPECGINVWGKPGLDIKCNECDVDFE